MRKAIILKCRQGSRFHFGEFAREQSTALFHTADYIHSDVIFAAFISSLAQICPEKTDVFREYFQQGNIRLSSGFYAIEYNKQTIFLLPKPTVLNISPTDNPKKFKKIQFMSKGVWEKGVAPDKWFSDNSPCISPNEKSIFLKEEIGSDALFPLSQKVDIQKVKARGAEDKDNLYVQTDLILQGNENYAVHWYFLAETNLKDEDEKLFYRIIGLLAANGIGGERSTGCGNIESVEYQDFEFQINHPSDDQVALSLVFPKEEGMNVCKYYQTKFRGGMCLGPEKRLPVATALLEGAVMSEKVKPDVLDFSQNEKKYWKYSGDFFLPLPLSFNP